MFCSPTAKRHCRSCEAGAATVPQVKSICHSEASAQPPRTVQGQGRACSEQPRSDAAATAGELIAGTPKQAPSRTCLAVGASAERLHEDSALQIRRRAPDAAVSMLRMHHWCCVRWGILGASQPPSTKACLDDSTEQSECGRKTIAWAWNAVRDLAYRWAFSLEQAQQESPLAPS